MTQCRPHRLDGVPRGGLIGRCLNPISDACDCQIIKRMWHALDRAAEHPGAKQTKLPDTTRSVELPSSTKGRD